METGIPDLAPRFAHPTLSMLTRQFFKSAQRIPLSIYPSVSCSCASEQGVLIIIRWNSRFNLINGIIGLWLNSNSPEIHAPRQEMLPGLESWRKIISCSAVYRRRVGKGVKAHGKVEGVYSID